MFTGSIVALVTPFDATGEIDYLALQKLVAMHLEAGTNGIVVGGSTGESVCLHQGELAGLLDAVVGQVAGKIPVIAGTGSSSTEKTMDATQLAESMGASAALVVTPCYNRPTQGGLLAHYRAVADSSNLPIILYNVPGRTGVDLLPETTRELAQHSQIVALKEAVGNEQRIAELLNFCSDDFFLLSGDDHSCLRTMEHGAKGVISVAANVVPWHFQRLCKAVVQGDLDRARKEDMEMRELFDMLMLESNPIPVKWALHEMSMCEPGLRLPLTVLSEHHRCALQNCLAKLGVLA